MQDFINMAASQLGISTQQSSSATAGILGVLQKQMGGGDFSNLLGSLPGAGDILKQATGGAMGGMLGGVLGGNKSGGGNAMGGIMQAASGLLGGNKGGGGDILGLLGGVLGNSGMSMDKLGPFMGLFLNYVQGQAGQGGLNSILGALPDLKKFIG
jgi:hypothetical protein